MDACRPFWPDPEVALKLDSRRFNVRSLISFPMPVRKSRLLLNEGQELLYGRWKRVTAHARC